MLALAVRIAAVLTRPMIEMDEVSYVRMAQNLAASRGPLEITGLDSTNFSPLLPLLIAGVAAVVRDPVVSAYIVSVVFGSLLLVPVFLLGKEFAGSRIGLMAAALAAVMPIFVDHSSRIYSENVFIFFLLLAIVFARHMLQGCRIPCSTLAGAALGAAYLANPSALFYLFLFVALAIVVALRRGILTHMLRALLVMVLMFSIYAVPYAIFLHSQLGEWSYQGKASGNSYAAGLGLRHNTLEWEQEMLTLTDGGGGAPPRIRLHTLADSADPAGNLLIDPVRSLRILARQMEFLYSRGFAMVMPLWLLPLMGLGLFCRGWTRSRAEAAGYLLLMMTPVLLVLTVYNAYTRLFMPLVALTLVWVAQGWLRLEEWGRETVEYSFVQQSRGRWGLRVWWLTAAAVILPLLAFSAVTVRDRDYAEGHRRAGESLAGEAVSREARVMSRESASAFYSGGTQVLLPYAGYSEMTAYARSQGVDYLIISRRDVELWRPQLAPLLGDESRHPEWRQVTVALAGTDEETFVFAAAE